MHCSTAKPKYRYLMHPKLYECTLDGAAALKSKASSSHSKNCIYCKASLAVHSRGGRLEAGLVPWWSTWCSINQTHQTLQLQLSHILCCAYCLHGLDLICQISIHGLCIQHRFRYLNSCIDVHFPAVGLRCCQFRRQEGLNEIHRLSSRLQRSLIDCLVAQPEKKPVFIEVRKNLSKCRFLCKLWFVWFACCGSLGIRHECQELNSFSYQIGIYSNLTLQSDFSKSNL